MEETNFKNYVIVTKELRANLEQIMQDNKIYQRARFINVYNVENFFRDQLKNLKGVDFLIFDLSAFPTSSDDDILKVLKSIREFYECRIIIIAEGYKQGDSILGKIFNLGIYNIITASNDLEFEEQLKRTISQEGMTFGNSLKYRIDESSQNNKGKTIVKEIYTKVKQTITIGIASTEKHSGATSLALNLAKFISQFDNTTVCYIENNDHNTIEEFTKLPDVVAANDKITYKELDMFKKPQNIADIQKYDYSFYIYDFGNFDGLKREERNNFITRDLKILVSGSQIWEEEPLADALTLIGNDVQCYLYINKIKPEKKDEFLKILPKEWQERTIFSEDILDPFEIKNKDSYNNILKPYLLNQNITTKSKKGLFGIFK